MLKGKFAVLSLAAAALLCWQLSGVDTVNSGIVDNCNSTASGTAGVNPACPQGDGKRLDDSYLASGAAGNLTIAVHAEDNTGAAIPNIPAADIWLKGCANLLVLCGGSGAINADQATDSNGNTTISGDLAVGGCDTGVNVVIQGIVLGGGTCPVICIAVAVRSVDQKNPGGGGPDLLVSLADFSYFGTGYTSPPKAYISCIDFIPSPAFGTVTLADFAFFGSHYNHRC